MKRMLALFLALLLLTQPICGPVFAAQTEETAETTSEETVETTPEETTPEETTPAEGGEPEEEPIIEISTAEDLDAIRENLDGHYRLTCDIDMSGMFTFAPIGNEVDGGFTGILDGAGYTIRNLELCYDTYKYVGLFGYLDGTVEDLVLEDVVVEAGRYGGALAGYADVNSTIRDITVSGSVTVGSTYFADYAGGVVGYSMTGISGCTNHATVSGKDYAGGIAAVVEGDVTDCINYGRVKTAPTGGGIAQRITGVVENCHNYGTISGKSTGTSGSIVAGIVASGASLITGCTNAGTINSGAATACGIGCGETIRECSATGDFGENGYVCGIGKATTFERCYVIGGDYDTTYLYGIGIGNTAIDCYSVMSDDYCKDIHLVTNGTDIGCMGVNFSRSYYSRTAPTTDTNSIAFFSGYYSDDFCNLGRYTIGDYTLDEIAGKYDALDYTNLWTRDEGWSSGMPKPANLPEYLELSDLVLILDYGETAQLKARVGDTEVDVTELTWTSADTSVATVVDGYVTVLGSDGEVTWLSARTADGLRMDCMVVVSDGLPNSITIEQSNQTLRMGRTFQFTAILDSLATKGRTITWSSSDPSVATVDKNGLVTTHAYGTATITATTVNGRTASRTVDVRYAQEFTLQKTDVVVGYNQYVKVPFTLKPVGALDSISSTSTDSDFIRAYYSGGDTFIQVNGYGRSTGSEAYQTITLTTTGGLKAQINAVVVDHEIASTASVNIGRTSKLGLTLYPTDFEQTITWSSSDESIATVDQNGRVTGIRPGAVTITAKSESGVTKTCTLTVTNYANELHLDRTSICMRKGATDQITARMLPADATSTLSYSSSNTSVVTVSSSGLLTAKGTGSAIITVKASGRNITATCSVTVVSAEVPATDLILSHEVLSLDPGEKAVLTAAAVPENTTQSAVTWTSSNTAVATVNSSGVVTAVASGTAEITATLPNGISRTCVVGVRTQEPLEFSVAGAIASPGETIEVPFILDQNPGVSAMRLKISYDSTLLTPLAITAGTILGSATISGSVDADGVYYALWSCPQDLTATGTMFTLTFAVSADAPLDTVAALEISYEDGDICNEDHVELRAIVNQGAVSIMDRLGGDVYEDRVLNAHDILLLQQYLTELVTFTNHQKTLGDLDLDSSITMKDLVLLAQTLTNPTVSAIAAAPGSAILPQSAVETFTVTTGTEKLGGDGTVTLPVTFSGCPGISAFKFHIGYDDELYALESVAGATDAITAGLMTNLETSGDAVVTWYSSQDLDLEGQVLLLTFRLRDGVSAVSSDVVLTCADSDICDQEVNQIPVTLVSGGIRVSVTVASGWSGYVTWVLTDDGVITFSGEGAMKNYASKTAMPWYPYADRISDVVIGEGVTSIGSYAFYGMPMGSIAIADSVTTIGAYAFKGCEQLDGVVLPSGLTKLGESAFYGCTALTAIEIPASLWTVQPYTFKNCTALESVTFHEGNLQKISDGAFYGTALKEVTFPDCLDIIDVYAFKGCSDLETIELGTGVTEIREAVFYGTAIPTITIPEGVTKIGPYAFKNCVELVSVDLPSTLTSVGEAGFYACTALESVVFPDAVTAIGNYAFRKCAAMTSVTFGSELTTIGECSFYGCTGLTELVIPDQVTTIKPYAFKTCTGLTDVTLGSGVSTIGEGAFNTCTGLKTIVFPASLTSIGSYCFSGSYNLWQLTFEGDAPSISTGAFKGMNATAYYPGDNATWTSDIMQNYGGTIVWKAN